MRFEGCFSLWIGGLALPLKRAEFFMSAPADRLDQLRIGVTHKIGKRRGFPVFLSHKEKGQKRGEQNGSGCQLQGFKGDQRRKAFSGNLIAHLIVILREDREAGSGNLTRAASNVPWGVKVPTCSS